ncbi:DNA repair protein RadC [Pseudacidovorax sp. 1753]|uniref:PLxRFG domain-containing protein n=1 Tax=Pseudacidovorax sp. 1753 TaxID=3156419 RepID=UPI0033952CE6
MLQMAAAAQAGAEARDRRGAAGTPAAAPAPAGGGESRAGQPPAQASGPGNGQRVAELQAQIDYIRQQGRGGWTKQMVTALRQAEQELATLVPPTDAPPTNLREGLARARARRAAPQQLELTDAQGAAAPNPNTSAAAGAVPAAGSASLEAPGVAAARPSTTQKKGRTRGPQAPEAQQAAPRRPPQAEADRAAAGRTAEAARAADAPELTALRAQLQEVERRIAAAAPDSGGDVEVAMRSRKAPVPLKAQRRRLQAAVAGWEQAQASAAVEARANQAATSPQNDRPEPTDGQKDAGNYAMGHLSGPEVQGLRITIENPAGSARSGISPDGKAWSNTMAAHYGYVKGSIASDGDHVDIFVGPNPSAASTVYVVDQVNPDGSYDEAKALFGFDTKADAIAAYKGSYDRGWKVGPVTAMSVDEFKKGLASGRFKKPVATPTPAAANGGTAQYTRGVVEKMRAAGAVPAASPVPARRQAEAPQRTEPGPSAGAGEFEDVPFSRSAGSKAIRDIYTQDLFGAPVKRPADTGSDGAGVRRDVQPAAGVPGDTPAPAGQYLVRTIVGSEAERKLGASTIRSFADLAAATQYLYRSAVERFDGIVTDKDGKPLAVVGGFKGALAQTSVFAPTLVAEAVRVPGAAHIWFSHNHPSGNSTLSTADEFTESMLRDVFRGTGIEPMGLIAVGNGRYSASDGDRGDIVPRATRTSVPVIEREQIPSSAEPVQLTSPGIAREVAKTYYEQSGGPGAILLDAGHGVVGWMPIGKAMMGDLRGTGQLRALYRAVSEANAGAVILAHAGELDGPHPSSVSVSKGQNVAAAFDKVSVRPLDMIDVRTGSSAAEVGGQVASGPVFSRSDDAASFDVQDFLRTMEKGSPAVPTAGRVADVRRHVAQLTSRWTNSPDVQVVASMSDPAVPASVRSYNDAQLAQGASGAPEGFFHGGKVYLVADQLASRDDVARALFHEALGHYGLRGVFGSGLTNVLNMVATTRKADVQAKAEAYGLNLQVPRQRLMAAEEVLAELAQTSPQLGVVRQAIAAVRTWLRENVPGFERLALSDAEIVRNYLAPARSWVERGAAMNEGSRQPATTAGRQSPGVVQPAAGFQREYAADTPFSRTKVADFRMAAQDRLAAAMSHPGTVSIWDKTVGTMRNLAERSPAFKPVYESAQRFIDDISMFANDAADTAPRLLPRVENWRDLTKKPLAAKDNAAIARPLFEGTLSWARDADGKPVRVEELTQRYAGLASEEKAQMMLRAGRLNPNVLKMWQGMQKEQFDSAVNSRFESQMLQPGVVWSDQELRDIFKADDGQISLYREARAAVERSIDMTARADMLRALGREYADLRDIVLDGPTMRDAVATITAELQDEARTNPDRADRVADLLKQVQDREEKAQELMDKGYMPLSRFGRYTVDVVDAAGERQYFGMFESKSESNAMEAKMKGLYPDGKVTQGTMSQEAFKLFQGLTPESLEMFGNMLGLDGEGGAARDKAFQEYLRLAKNNHSALKRLIHRQGIAGFSEDVGRVLANFVYSNARLASGGVNAGQLERAVSDIPKEQGQLKDLAMGLQQYIQNPQEEGHAVRAMLFAQYLGGSIASALVNTTQPFAITMPWLSQYGGMRQAAAQLAGAVRDMAARGKRFEADLAHALHQAEVDGVVSPQEIHQLMAQARGAGALRAGDGTRVGNARAAASNAWERTKVVWGQPFALAEQFNRRSTFIAAYRVAKAEHMPNPAEFARRAVLETQFVYSKANKPRWARGPIGGTLFTFKTYSVSYLELLNRMWTQGGPEGKRAVAWAMATMMLMGGAGGLPFMEDLEDLIDAIGQMLGYNISSKQWRKQALQSVLGKEMADFVEQGVSGLPGAPVDVSGRLGLGNIIPGTGMLLTKQDHSTDMLELAGPAGDLLKRGFTAAGQALKGDLGGAALSVAPTAVTNAVKGADMLASGMYKDRKGYKVIDTTVDEALAKAIGFQPKSVADVQEANSYMQRAKAFYTQTSSEIKAQWAQALFEKDEGGVEAARQRVKDWNEANPEQPIVVKMTDVWKRVREMNKDRTSRIEASSPKALRQRMHELAVESRY